MLKNVSFAVNPINAPNTTATKRMIPFALPASIVVQLQRGRPHAAVRSGRHWTC
jgi:hypothetical protein